MSIWISLDVESDGPAPGVDMYSMISFGAVVLNDLSNTFYGLTAPISEKWIPEALAVSNISREQHLKYPTPEETMKRFDLWAKSLKGPLTLVSDNPAYDAQWMNYYCHKYLGYNPFGFSARRIGDMFAGLERNSQISGRHWKKLRKTKHTHNPVDDAMGNAEALIELNKRYNFNVPL